MSSQGSITADDLHAEDPADVIMDNIDEQLSRVKPKQLGLPLQSPRRQQRLEVDNTGNRTVSNDVKSANHGSRLQAPSKRRADILGHSAEAGDDTGLGSVSFDGDQSDVDVDLDFEPDVDHDDDEFLDNGTYDEQHLKPNMAANDSSRHDTRQRLAAVNDALERQIDARFRETMATIAGSVQRKQRQFDMESVQTDEFESEFHKTMVNPVSDFHSAVDVNRRNVRQHRAPSMTSNDHNEIAGSNVAAAAMADDIDAMSVRTEEFETQFMQTIPAGSVKLIANTPVSKFDQFIVDSDVDTVKSQSVRDTFQNALSRTDHSARVASSNQRLSSTLPRRTQNSRRKRESSPSSDVDADYDSHRIVRPSRTLQADIERWKKSVQSTDPQPPSTGNRRSMKAAGVQRTASSIDGTSRTAAYTALDNKVDYELSNRLKQELAKVQSEIKLAMQNKQALQQTNEKLQSLAAQHHLEILKIEKQLKDSRTAAENVRAELVLADFKREASRKELESLTSEIDNRRLQLQRLAVQEKLAAEQQANRLSTAAKDDEAEANLAAGAASAAAAAEEITKRKELEDAMNETRLGNEQLSLELRIAKERLETLQQEVERNKRELSELSEEKKRLQNRVSEAEQKNQLNENDKKAALKRKEQECETLKMDFENQLEANREKSRQEIARLEETIHELNNQLRTSAMETQSRSDEIVLLRERLNEQAVELEKLTQRQAQLIDENMLSLRGIIKEKEAAIKAIQDRAQEEKQTEIDEVCRTLKADHQRQLQEQEREFSNHVAALQGQLTGKDLEIQVLRDRVRELDEWLTQMNSRVQDEAYQKLQATLKDERSQWEMEKEAEITAQIESMKEEMVASGKQLREELQHERSISLAYKHQLEIMQEKLEQAQQASRAVYREVLQAAERDDVMSATFSHMHPNDKQRYQEQLAVTTEKLNEVVRKQKDEIDRLRRDNAELHEHMEERLAAIEKLERRLLEELSEQCDKLSQCLSSKPSASCVSTSSSVSWTSSKIKSSRGEDLQAAVLTAAANLKNCSEKVRDALTRQQQELDVHRKTVTKLTNDTKEEVEQVRRQLQEEKYQALEALKNRLVHDHLEEVQKLHRSLGKDTSIHMALREKDRELQDIQRNMKAWKEKTLAKLANKFKEEMNRELARRQSKLINSDGNQENGSRRVNFEPYDKSAGPILQQASLLQPHQNTPSARMDFSSAVRYKMAGSVPDLTALSGLTNDKDKAVAEPSDVTSGRGGGDLIHLRQLQLQLQRAESKWRMADDRARSNEHLLNQKLMEISKLQSIVAKQSKDLSQLQRAFGRPGSTGKTSNSSHK